MFTTTSGLPARALDACSQRATSSLPVPCSPVTSTFASDGPTRSMSRSTGCIAALSAISSTLDDASRRSARFSLSRRCVRRSARPSSTCVRSVWTSRASSHGFST